MTRIDPTFAGLFRMDWLVPMDQASEDDFTRAVAEKADLILESARFMSAQASPRELEVRVWVEGARASACVSITWEPGSARFGFHLLDVSLRDRLGCIVFDAVPSVDAAESAGQALLFESALRALALDSRRVPVAGERDE